MTDPRIENLNVKAEQPIITPLELKEQFPLSPVAIQTVMKGQQTIKNILSRKDKRLLVVVGPCSIHDIDSAKDYAQHLKMLADELLDELFIVMRVYFEKPRTTVGWQGLINDPYLDNSCQIEDGLKMARELLIYIAELGLPAAGEALDIVTPQYIQDLFSWTAIGARTTESQSHRNMASGLSTVVGFKNGTNGNVDIAINAIQSVAAPHNFVSIDPSGKVAVIKTTGNAHTHLILRGGEQPNYEPEHIREIEEKLLQAGHDPRIMIDCSHANSQKQAINQQVVLDSVAGQLQAGNRSILGVMLESHLNFGHQPLINDVNQLKYGVSITDECLDFEITQKILRQFSNKITDH
jgi:3-deoxy-7-phosphoheptulonate synthase